MFLHTSAGFSLVGAWSHLISELFGRSFSGMSFNQNDRYYSIHEIWEDTYEVKNAAHRLRRTADLLRWIGTRR